MSRITIQAEDVISSGYAVEAVSTATDGEVASLVLTGQTQGVLEFAFSGPSGSYNVDVFAYDENDGAGSFTLEVNGRTIGAYTLDASFDNAGSGGPVTSNRVGYDFDGVSLRTGDTIRITANTNGGEWMRIDEISFDSATNPTFDPDLVIEAEHVIAFGYVQQGNFSGASSNNAFVSLIDANDDQAVAASRGGLQQFFNGETGFYDVDLVIYDENDGESEYILSVNGVARGSVIADGDFGFAGVRSETRTTYTISDVAIAEGDVVTIAGIRDQGEFARVDQIVYRQVSEPPVNEIGTYYIEAENIIKSGYGEQNSDAASNGGYASLFTGVLNTSELSGELEHTFSGASGIYDLTLATFDEADGVSSITIQVNGQTVGFFTMDEGRTDGGVSAASLERYTLSDLALNTGDVVTIRGEREGGEWARIDAISYALSDGSPLPTPTRTIRVEAEDIIESGFVTERWAGLASGDEVATLFRGDSSGGLSYQFQGDAGEYRLSISYFDENDGASPVRVVVNGETVLATTMSRNLGTAGVTADNLTSININGLQLRPNDVIEVRSAINGGEWARIDGLTFTPTGPSDGAGDTGSITVEAEDAIEAGYGFVAETWNGIASGDAVATLYRGDDQGGLSYTFTGKSGLHTLSVTAFDESDGSSPIEILINGALVASDALDVDLGVPGISSANRRTLEFEGLDIATGDVIEIRSARDAGEFARIDSFTFTPEGAGSTPISNPETVTIQAEDIIATGFVRESWAGIAAGGEVASLFRGGETGTLSYTFTGEDGEYLLNIRGFDENDGFAPLAVRVNGVTIKQIVMSVDLGIPGVTADNLVNMSAAGLQLRSGDVIEIQGTKNLGEFVRLDEIALTRTGDFASRGGPTQIISVEAEDIISTGFVTEQWAGIASGDSVATLYRGDSTGTLSYAFGGEAGEYTISIAAFDENDGAASIEVLVNNGPVQTIVLDQDLGVPGISSTNLVSRQVIGVQLKPGDVVTFRGAQDGGEFLRVDDITFIPTGPSTAPRPTAFTVEAEAIMASGFVAETWSGIASGDQVATLFRGDSSGRLAYDFEGIPGEYTLSVAVFDENDGASPIAIVVNGEVVLATTLNRDLGVAGVSADNRYTINVSGLDLTTDDLIEIRSQRSGGEFARIDSLTFTPSSSSASSAKILPSDNDFLVPATSEKLTIAQDLSKSVEDAPVQPVAEIDAYDADILVGALNSNDVDDLI